MNKTERKLAVLADKINLGDLTGLPTIDNLIKKFNKIPEPKPSDASYENRNYIEKMTLAREIWLKLYKEKEKFHGKAYYKCRHTNGKVSNKEWIKILFNHPDHKQGNLYGDISLKYKQYYFKLKNLLL